MGEIIDFAKEFEHTVSFLKGKGYHVEWDNERDGNVMYSPENVELFIYGTSPQESNGAWCFLISRWGIQQAI